MTNTVGLDELWTSVPKSTTEFDPASLAELPEAARRYLTHAIRPGAPLANGVRLRMHGKIRRSNWYPFVAEQVNTKSGDMIWDARMRYFGLPVRGAASLLEGAATVDWKMFGLVSVASGEGEDVTRSAIGRIHGESIWMPTTLCGNDVSWSSKDPSHAKACLTICGQSAEISLGVARTGQLKRIRYQRWGNPDKSGYHIEDFGGYIDKEATFGNYTVPSVMRIGWYFGSERFEKDGEFFRVRLDNALYK